ncbi:MAG: hypothetical protein M0P21_11115 [Methanoculleus sp.]|nr:hypothetical protein [Methanoculleus sp.]
MRRSVGTELEHRGPGEEEVGEGRDERDLAAKVVAGDDLEDDEDEREIDDREPEEGFQGLPHPVGVEGEEGEEPCVPGADPGRSFADECVAGRPGEEEGSLSG